MKMLGSRYDEKHLVLLSVVCQLVDSGARLEELNPHIQEYICGLCEEFNSADPEEEEHFKSLYYYADTFFNNLFGVERTLN